LKRRIKDARKAKCLKKDEEQNVKSQRAFVTNLTRTRAAVMDLYVKLADFYKAEAEVEAKAEAKVSFYLSEAENFSGSLNGKVEDMIPLFDSPAGQTELAALKTLAPYLKEQLDSLTLKEEKSNPKKAESNDEAERENIRKLLTARESYKQLSVQLVQVCNELKSLNPKEITKCILLHNRYVKEILPWSLSLEDFETKKSELTGHLKDLEARKASALEKPISELTIASTRSSSSSSMGLFAPPSPVVDSRDSDNNKQKPARKVFSRRGL